MKIPGFRDRPQSAEAWVARLHAADCSADDRAAYAAWRVRRRDHADSFDRAERVHLDVSGFADDPILRAAAAGARRRLAQSRLRPSVPRWIVPVGAAAVLVLVVLGWRAYAPGAAAPAVQRYTAGVGPAHTLRLDDGSQLVLDADSSVSTRFEARERQLYVERGRAQFTVAAESRPFVVHAGTATIHDVGTVFQVDARNGATTVGLLQGAVSVTRDGAGAAQPPLALRPGQQVRIGADGRNEGIRPLDTDAAQGWANGVLVFRRHRLGDLLAEMNRYASPHVRLGDPTLSALPVSGVFRAGDQQGLVKALQTGWGLHARQTGAQELTLYRRTSGSGTR